MGADETATFPPQQSGNVAQAVVLTAAGKVHHFSQRTYCHLVAKVWRYTLACAALRRPSSPWTADFSSQRVFPPGHLVRHSDTWTFRHKLYDFSSVGVVSSCMHIQKRLKMPPTRTQAVQHVIEHGRHNGRRETCRIVHRARRPCVESILQVPSIRSTFKTLPSWR